MGRKHLVQAAGVAGFLIAAAIVHGDQLSDVIEAVRANELLFSDIDMTYREILDQPWVTVGAENSFNGMEMLLTRKHDYTVHQVMQAGRLRGDRTGMKDLSNGEQGTGARKIAFDGTTTRLLEQEAFGNIQEKKAADGLWRMPHMMFFKNRYLVSLSTLLSGHDAVRAENDSDLTPGSVLRIEYVGNESIAGLSCAYVVVETVVDPESRQTTVTDRIWLAVDRNYFPCRVESLTHRESEKHPNSVGEVITWRQLDDNIWFPEKMVKERYTRESVEAGERIVGWKRITEISDVSLTPDYPDEYFGLEFPAGIPVYRLSSSGEIIDELVQSGSGGELVPRFSTPATARASGEQFWRSGLVAGGSAVLVILVIGVFYRMRMVSTVGDR